MNKINLVVVITGEAKTGKTHMACDLPDSVCLDLTANRDSLAAAMNVYEDKVDEKYFWMEDWTVEDFEDMVSGSDARTIVIDTSTELRDMYGRKHLEYLNAVRKKDKKKPLPTIYPVTEWKVVYEYIEDMFRKNMDKNFIITANRKDVYVYDKDIRQSIRTGQRSMAGAKNLPWIADIVLHVSIEEKKVGSPPKIERSRRIRVVLNRFMDKANDEVWVEYVNGIEDLMDKIVERSKFKREMFLL